MAALQTLREARQQRGLSLQALAATSGVHWVTIWRCEVGRSVPLPLVRRSIAQALCMPPEQIDWQPRCLA